MVSTPDLIESNGFPVTLVFSKSGRAFFTERITGNLWEVIGEQFKLVKSFPIVRITGHHETGLLGVALDPEFDTNEFAYCFYTSGTDESHMKNQVVRINVNDGSEKIVIDNIPAGRIHNGGIIAFGPDNLLYVGVGVENTIMEKAQDLDYLGGKILRVSPDGSIPGSNPFPNSPIYSYGHRNIFGLAFHPITGNLYISEDGPEKDDEINIVKAGGNYGWPEVTGIAKKKKFVDPITVYTPTITPTQCCFDDKYFYFGSYNEGTVHRLTLGGDDFDKVIKDVVVYRGKSFGVIGVFKSPDGQFFVTTPNKILAFTPELD